ncbi:Arm DNA-binding domain-containing protein [Trichothermofontia sichuanensis]|uniref:Arm DNA-binding domain-containing protein n=1 Tax=Trichothermofontia sichuanensis TaxID=3045816 RepID=UPI0036F2E18B
MRWQAFYSVTEVNDTPDNRAIATRRLNAMLADIELGQFDPTLERYKPARHLAVVNTPASVITLADVWSQYLAFKTPTVSPSTLASTFGNVTRKLKTRFFWDFGVSSISSYK